MFEVGKLSEEQMDQFLGELQKISTVDAKVITARAVNKWLVDYKVAMEHNSPPQNSTSSPQRSVLSSPLSSTITQRAELVVSDTDRLYKPQFLAKVADSNFPSYSCSGSPWDRRNSPGQPPKPSSNPQSPCSTSKPASPSNKPRTVLQTLHRKIFCENCRVSVTDLDAHLTLHCNTRNTLPTMRTSVLSTKSSGTLH